MRKRFALLIGAVVLCTAGFVAAQLAPSRPAGPAVVDRDIAVYFSPNGGCLDAVANAIASARKSIHVQAFILSTTRVSRPLIEAHRRGVEVIVIFDHDWANEPISLDEDLVEAGIPVYLDAPQDGSAHSKIMIIDRQTVLTGSFNFSRSADENNTENLLAIRNRPLIAGAYEKNFQARLAVSKKHPKMQ